MDLIFLEVGLIESQKMNQQLELFKFGFECGGREGGMIFFR